MAVLWLCCGCAIAVAVAVLWLCCDYAVTVTVLRLSRYNGSNMGWHQDGWSPGCYLGHYYINHTLDDSMDWFEIGLPDPSQDRKNEEDYGPGDSDSDGDGFVHDFMSEDGHRVQ